MYFYSNMNKKQWPLYIFTKLYKTPTKMSFGVTTFYMAKKVVRYF